MGSELKRAGLAMESGAQGRKQSKVRNIQNRKREQIKKAVKKKPNRQGNSRGYYREQAF